MDSFLEFLEEALTPKLRRQSKSSSKQPSVTSSAWNRQIGSKSQKSFKFTKFSSRKSSTPWNSSIPKSSQRTTGGMSHIFTSSAIRPSLDSHNILKNPRPEQFDKLFDSDDMIRVLKWKNNWYAWNYESSRGSVHDSVISMLGIPREYEYGEDEGKRASIFAIQLRQIDSVTLEMDSDSINTSYWNRIKKSLANDKAFCEFTKNWNIDGVHHKVEKKGLTAAERYQRLRVKVRRDMDRNLAENDLTFEQTRARIIKAMKGNLSESSWKNDLYHSTQKDFDPKDIKQGSHFGDLRASVERGWDKNSKKIHAFRFNPDGKVVRVKDTWKDRYAEPSIARQLHRKGILSTKEKDLVKKMSDRHFYTAKWPPPAKVLNRYLKRKGISAVKYKNSTEHRGSDSTIVYDPKSIEPHHTFEHPEILRHHKSKLKKRTKAFGKFGRNLDEARGIQQ